MPTTIELSLKTNLYAALESEAQQRNQTIEEIVEAAVTNFLAASSESAQPDITPEFARHLSEFIDQYRPALEALAK